MRNWLDFTYVHESFYASRESDYTGKRITFILIRPLIWQLHSDFPMTTDIFMDFQMRHKAWDMNHILHSVVNKAPTPPARQRCDGAMHVCWRLCTISLLSVFMFTTVQFMNLYMKISSRSKIFMVMSIGPSLPLCQVWMYRSGQQRPSSTCYTVTAAVVCGARGRWHLQSPHRCSNTNCNYNAIQDL